MKRGTVALVIVVFAIVGFWWRSRNAEDLAGPKRSSPTHSSGSSEPGIANRPLRMSSDKTPKAVPKRYSGAEDRPKPPIREYVRDDGTIVRDHTSNPMPPQYQRHGSLPATLSKVEPKTLIAVRKALRPAMMKCIAENAPDAQEGSKAQAVLTVSVTNELLRIDKLEFQSEGLNADTEDALRACAVAAMVGHEQEVVGAKDVERHFMTFPYQL